MGSTQSIRKGFMALALCTAACLTLLFTAGQSAALTAGGDLGVISMDKSILWAPGRLAVGSDGTLYVVDSYKNHILRFGPDGSYLGDIPFPRVSAVAVAPDGTLYIGSHNDYSVSIYQNGKVTGFLGKGAKEFSSIRDIAVDATTGTVYVVDNVGNAVRVFTAGGKDLGTISQVNLPISMEITPTEIYIIDSPLAQDPTVIGRVAVTTSSRISVFDKQYRLLRTIDEERVGDRMYRPTDLAIFNGQIYITDAALKTVLLFDVEGNYLGEIPGASGSLNNAVSLAFSPEGVLYVSSSETHSIHRYDAMAGGRQ